MIKSSSEAKIARARERSTHYKKERGVEAKLRQWKSGKDQGVPRAAQVA